MIGAFSIVPGFALVCTSGGWLIVTFLLGAGFVGMEIYEFRHLIEEGFGVSSEQGFIDSNTTLAIGVLVVEVMLAITVTLWG